MVPETVSPDVILARAPKGAATAPFCYLVGWVPLLYEGWLCQLASNVCRRYACKRRILPTKPSRDTGVDLHGLCVPARQGRFAALGTW